MAAKILRACAQLPISCWNAPSDNVSAAALLGSRGAVVAVGAGVRVAAAVAAFVGVDEAVARDGVALGGGVEL